MQNLKLISTAMKKIYLVLVLFFLSVFTSPASSQIDTTGLNPFLDWPDLPGAVYYRLQVALNTNFNSPVIDISGLTQSQYQVMPGILICNTVYYWRYCGYIGGSWGNWSTPRAFFTSCPVGITQSGTTIPDKFVLYQNYPNPFNPSTKIKFDIPSSSFTTVAVSDVVGKKISVLASQELSAGSYEVTFDGSNLPSGIYFYKIEAGEYVNIKKMVLVK
jgi:hypothetical protein